jgi:hypothetical protein
MIPSRDVRLLTGESVPFKQVWDDLTDGVMNQMKAIGEYRPGDSTKYGAREYTYKIKDEFPLLLDRCAPLESREDREVLVAALHRYLQLDKRQFTFLPTREHLDDLQGLRQFRVEALGPALDDYLEVGPRLSQQAAGLWPRLQASFEAGSTGEFHEALDEALKVDPIEWGKFCGQLEAQVRGMLATEENGVRLFEEESFGLADRALGGRPSAINENLVSLTQRLGNPGERILKGELIDALSEGRRIQYEMDPNAQDLRDALEATMRALCSAVQQWNLGQQRLPPRERWMYPSTLETLSAASTPLGVRGDVNEERSRGCLDALRDAFGDGNAALFHSTLQDALAETAGDAQLWSELEPSIRALIADGPAGFALALEEEDLLLSDRATNGRVSDVLRELDGLIQELTPTKTKSRAGSAVSGIVDTLFGSSGPPASPRKPPKWERIKPVLEEAETVNQLVHPLAEGVQAHLLKTRHTLLDAMRAWNRAQLDVPNDQGRFMYPAHELQLHETWQLQAASLSPSAPQLS